MSRRGQLPSHGGYTLLELLVSMLGATVLMVGLSSSIFIALKATDTTNTPSSTIIEGNAALNDSSQLHSGRQLINSPL
jgi:Tfp pilus assembly protein PilW